MLGLRFKYTSSYVFFTSVIKQVSATFSRIHASKQVCILQQAKYHYYKICPGFFRKLCGLVKGVCLSLICKFHENMIALGQQMVVLWWLLG